MPEQQTDLRPHFVLADTAQTEHFRSTVSGNRESSLPNLDRQVHGRALLGQLANLKAQAAQATEAQREAGMDAGFGIQIQFRSQPDVELAFESLAKDRQHIELLNVRHEENVTYATVFVPDGKLEAFERIIQDYLEEKRTRDGTKSLDHKALVNTIQEVRAATFDALWTDDPSVLPADETLSIWWEIWLPVRGDRDETLSRFRSIATGIGFELSSKVIQFPERTVLHMRGSKRQITQSMLLLNTVAEIRRAKETAEFFDSLTPPEQHDWVQDLLDRTSFADSEAPHVCLLDTGVNRGHPLLESAIGSDDLHTIEPAWGPQDAEGHGTQMAGLALFGDLMEPLATTSPIAISHRLESVKLLPHHLANLGEPYGELTIEAVGRPEVEAPHRRRVFSMAVTTKDSRDRGRPSAWSAALDSLACDALGEGLTSRLIVVSSGNVEIGGWGDYPHSNETDGIHDPGQSWNALTVGAYTQKIVITEDDAQGFQPIAPAGSLSPFSTTSLTWPATPWPYKPDVVFEGGNAAKDTIGPSSMHSLSLLTVHHRPIERLLTTANATSAASALCARMAAQIMAQYPDLWPETVRALIVHSAEWTPRMQADFLDARKRKEDYAKLIRHVGYGVPNLEAALWSLSNSLTLIVQDSLQPFQRDGSKEPTARDMHLHRLPWPKEALQDLGEIPVEMRVTLSYFIEPNPGVVERGVKGRYRYESHGLRFEVKRPEETEQSFRMRINQRARDEDEGSYQGGGSDSNWRLGPKLRHLGSLHSDTWTGTAAQLAERGILAIYPALGWWKTAKKLERYNNRARYALVVTIKAPETTVDLYNVVAQTINTPVTIQT
jgi:hypothetical protein